MDDPPIQKIAISGPTLASLIHRFTTAPSSVEGLLFGHVTHIIPLNLSDDSTDSSSSSPTLLATITGFLSTSSFHDSSGTINPTSLKRLLPNSSSFLGWFSGRRRSPLRPSMRESSITLSLSSLSQFSSPIQNLPEPSSSSSSSFNFNPCLFLLLASPLWDQSSHIHTHEYRAYQFQRGTESFEPKSIDIVNIGPAFRGHYGSFSPNSPFPGLDCQLGRSSPMNHDDGEERLSRIKQASKDQKELDSCAEGFEVGRLSKLMGSEAKSYTQGLEDLYLKMLAKIENLTHLVEKSSAKVLEQESHNRKLKHKILRSAASE